jgi:hypothetical protein
MRQIPIAPHEKCPCPIADSLCGLAQSAILLIGAGYPGFIACNVRCERFEDSLWLALLILVQPVSYL